MDTGMGISRFSIQSGTPAPASRWITLSIEALLEIKQLKREGWRIDAARWFGSSGSWIEPLPQPGAATGGGEE